MNKDKIKIICVISFGLIITLLLGFWYGQLIKENDYECWTQCKNGPDFYDGKIFNSIAYCMRPDITRDNGNNFWEGKIEDCEIVLIWKNNPPYLLDIKDTYGGWWK